MFTISSAARNYTASSVCMAALHGTGVSLRFDGGIFSAGSVSKAHLLPTYAWQRRDYWNEGRRALRERMGVVEEQQFQDHQPNRLLSIFLQQPSKEGVRFRGTISKESVPEILDHVFGGSVLFPGVKYIEIIMALSIFLDEERKKGTPGSLFNKLCVENLQFVKPLYLSAHSQSHIMEITAVPEPSREQMRYYKLSIKSRLHGLEDKKFVVNATCNLVPAEEVPSPSPPPLKAVLDLRNKPKGTEHKTSKSFYGKFATLGFDYGSNFQFVEETWRAQKHQSSLKWW